MGVPVFVPREGEGPKHVVLRSKIVTDLFAADHSMIRRRTGDGRVYPAVLVLLDPFAPMRPNQEPAESLQSGSPR